MDILLKIRPRAGRSGEPKMDLKLRALCQPTKERCGWLPSGAVVFQHLPNCARKREIRRCQRNSTCNSIKAWGSQRCASMERDPHAKTVVVANCVAKPAEISC